MFVLCECRLHDLLSINANNTSDIRIFSIFLHITFFEIIKEIHKHAIYLHLLCCSEVRIIPDIAYHHGVI